MIALCGIMASVVTAYRLINYPVIAEIKEHHVYYGFHAPNMFVVVTSVLYFIATIFPGYLSGIKHMKLLASLLLCSLIVSKIFYSVYLISVWCFFAALLSVVVVYVLKNSHLKDTNHSHLDHLNLTGDYKKDHGLEH